MTAVCVIISAMCFVSEVPTVGEKQGGKICFCCFFPQASECAYLFVSPIKRDTTSKNTLNWSIQFTIQTEISVPEIHATSPSFTSLKGSNQYQVYHLVEAERTEREVVIGIHANSC